MKTETIDDVGPASAMSEGITVGDFVKIGSDSEYEYEVAEIRRFPHGSMVGIYDEPPSKHVDFWNASSLTLARKGAKP